MIAYLSTSTPEKPPTEFRIFTAERVETTKGTFIFDAAAAKSVMADYRMHGVDLMIDYDHASLSAFPVDPAQAGKAAGWFGLALRNGELWAVNVRWTPPAAQALARKEWRYTSPAFELDKEGRVTRLLNVAITNIPATHGLTPLMAASTKKPRARRARPVVSNAEIQMCRRRHVDLGEYVKVRAAMKRVGGSR